MTRKKQFYSKRGPKPQRSPYHRQPKAEKHEGINISFTPEDAVRVRAAPEGQASYVRKALRLKEQEASWEAAAAKIVDAVRDDLQTLKSRVETIPSGAEAAILAGLLTEITETERTRYITCRQIGIFPLVPRKIWGSETFVADLIIDEEWAMFWLIAIELFRDDAPYFRGHIDLYLRRMKSLEKTVEKCRPWLSAAALTELAEMKVLKFHLRSVLDYVAENPRSSDAP